MPSAIGTLQANLILDRPNDTYWGSNDALKGRVLVVLDANPNAASTTDQRELFGPLTLKVTLRGRTVQTFTSGNFKYKEQRGLVTLHTTVHDGPYRFIPGVRASFPFAINFPATTSITKPDSSELSGYVFRSDSGQTLPPSLEIWGRDLKVATEYRLGVSGGMPGISIKFMGRPAATGPLVKFDWPRSEPDSMSQRTHPWKEVVRIPEWQFLPAAERPNFLKRFADSLSSREQSSDFQFEMIATVPLDLYMNEPLQIVFKLNRRDSDAEDQPPISMTLPTVKIWAETRANFTRTLIKNKTLSYNMSSFELEKVLRVSSPDTGTDFGHTDNAKTVSTGKIEIRPSSFDTGVLARAYTLQVEYAVSVAGGKEIKLKRSFGIKLHPPVRRDAANAGVTRRRGSAVRSMSLPRYESSTVPPYCEANDEMARPLRVETVAS